MRRLISHLRLDREEGQVLPLFAAAAGALLLMTGVVIDGGNQFQNKQALQNTADAAAIAAALEVSKATCTPSSEAACATYAGLYAGYGGVSGAEGTKESLTAPPLPPCGGSVTDTDAAATAPPGCYQYPYVDSQGTTHNEKVMVWLTQKQSNYFGGLFGIRKSALSARALGTVTSGDPPPYTWAALADHCDKHTLLIKLGGSLTVTSGIYVNSCDDHDGFDVFNAGSIAAPKIQTVGGWETHGGSNVCGSQATLCVPPTGVCAFPRNSGGTDWKIVATPTPTAGYNPPRPGCPFIGQPKLVDPFANFPPAPIPGVVNVGTPVSITKASRGLNGAASNVAIVTTASAHGLSVGDSVTVSGVGFGFDGAFTVAAAPAPTSTTFAYANTGATLPAITNRQMDGGIVTLTTSAPTTLGPAPGGPDTQVTVANINSIFNVTNAPLTGSTLLAPYGFSYNSPLANRTFTVTKKGLQQGTAKLNLTSTAGLSSGMTVTVSGVDGLLNGSFDLSAVAGGANPSISYPVSATQFLNVNQKAIATSTTVTLTTSTNHVASGDQITVNIGDSRFDGTFTATDGGGTGAAGGTTLEYTIPLVRASITNAVASGGTFTLTTATGPPIENGDTVAIATGLLAYNGASAVSSVNTGSHTFVYAPGTFQNSSWTYSSAAHTVTLTTATAHGLLTGNVITTSGFGGAQTCMNVTNATVTAATSTTFTYAVPASCNPGASGNQQKNIALVTAASHAVSGTVSLTTASVIVSPTCIHCITVPAFITAGTAAPAGPPTPSAVLTDVPLFASSTGTFTPPWMPTTGLFAQNLPGSAPLPTPTTITTGTQILQPKTYYGGLCIGVLAGQDCGTNSVPANCKVAGGSTTSVVSYSTPVHLSQAVPDNFDPTGSGDIHVTPGAVIAVDDVIAIDDEEMLVTAVSGGTVTVTREWDGTEDGVHANGTEVKLVVTTPNGTAYAPAKKLGAAVAIAAPGATTTIQVNATNPNPVGVGDIIQIENEAMKVTGIPDNTHLTVTRGWFSTTPAPHANGKAILKVFDASVPPPPSVTLAKGVYIMAGGGFHVCGAASVNAPNGVMIYNTNDPVKTTGYGALSQVNINTAGAVHLHPMTDGLYAGMTIFQDRALTLNSAACDGKSKNPAQWDIALQSAASLPLSGALGSVTGTIYAPHLNADFGVSMSGTSNLAIITSCIYINGSQSKFTHDTSDVGNFFGVSAGLGG